MSFAFFLVSDLAWIGYCEVTEGSLSVFFCNHDEEGGQHHSGAMNHQEQGDQMDPQMDPHSKKMEDHKHLEGLSCKTICYLKASQPNGGADATHPLKRGLAHSQDLLTVLAHQKLSVHKLDVLATVEEAPFQSEQFILDVDPHPPKVL
jgi:hypothetical protein